jgi:hypothetical protein
MQCRNPCRLYIHLAFTCYVGPPSVVDRLRLFHQWECLKCNGHGLSVSCVKWPLVWRVWIEMNHPPTYIRGHVFTITLSVGVMKPKPTLVEHIAKKQTAVVFPLQFFRPPWYAIIKQLHICFFGLPTKILGILGLVIYRWIGIENIFPTLYYMPSIF